MSASPRPSPTWLISAVSRWRANLACWVRWETGMGDKEDGHGAEGKLSPRPAAHQFPTKPSSSSKETKVDAPGRLRWGPRTGRLPNFTRKPDGDILAHERDRGNPPQIAEHASGDARFRPRCRRDLQDIINANGGKMKPTWGACRCPRSSAASRNGVRKINIDTDNRMAMTGQIRKVLKRGSQRIRSAQISHNPRWRAMAKLCKQRLAGIQHRGSGPARSRRC